MQTYKEEDNEQLQHDVHFWIGKYSSQVPLKKDNLKLSDASGKMQFSEVKTGSISEGDLDTKDVFIVDTKPGLFVWIGKGTSTDEKKNALAYAHNYLQNTSYPFAPVSCIKEGQESKTFKIH
ncbi:hypothetical protein KUTeg_021373 [Tegillarca granosa]|uniref:Gelsolin-like domain-containing protein n=1 Tax=Tegillarca granosa TaxID=220873 RepID=A0ABQ9ED98_TEGGR|nr:hypothetical protein KUTeg_021373 [Tegillarca granosa]